MTSLQHTAPPLSHSLLLQYTGAGVEVASRQLASNFFPGSELCSVSINYSLRTRWRFTTKGRQEESASIVQLCAAMGSG